MATSRPQSPRSHRRRVPTRDPAATAGEKKNRRGRRAAHLLRFKRSSRAGDASPCRPHTGLARSTSGSPLDPAPFRQDEPRGGATAPQGKTPTLLSRQGLEPVASAAKALSPTEPGGETQVEATCVNARRKVGTDPGSIPGASATSAQREGAHRALRSRRRGGRARGRRGRTRRRGRGATAGGRWRGRRPGSAAPNPRVCPRPRSEAARR